MKREDLLEGFGALDDDLLKRSEQNGITLRKRRYLSEFMKYVSIAACFAAALSAGALFLGHNTPDSDFVLEGGAGTESGTGTENSSGTGSGTGTGNGTGTGTGNGTGTESGEGASAEQSHLQKTPETYVDISTLLASNKTAKEQTLKTEATTVVEQLSLKIGRIELENHSAYYHNVTSAGSEVLGESIGHELDGTPNWYTVSGHEDMQYLISHENNEYSLWKFDSFQEESYPYREVLQMIYHIYSAEDIAKIIVSPANMDNTDAGQAIQAEIGTTIITEEDSIETIYHILSGLTCYGENHWDKIGLGDDTPSSLLDQVRAGRYLTIVTSQGMELDTLKYTGISGMFYEYGGIAYSALTAEEKKAVEDILKIEWTEEPSGTVTGEVGSSNSSHEKSGTNEHETASTAQEIPVDEGTYQEARTYSAELIDLQNRISEAMRNQELPFVMISAIYENPDRLHVTVNTQEEDCIAKLRAFDTTGLLLEIEYSEGSNLYINPLPSNVPQYSASPNS